MKYYAIEDAELAFLDNTHKTNYNGYPLGILAASDRARVNHTLVIFLASGEKHEVFREVVRAAMEYGNGYSPKGSMSDFAAAIYNGVSEVVPNLKNLKCYKHMTAVSLADTLTFS